MIESNLRSAQQQLRELIQVGALRPHDEIDPAELAHRLGFDQGEMRAAIANLEAFGLFERLPGGCFRVRVLDRAEMYDFVRMRLDIETRVAEALAFSATDEDISIIRAELEMQREVAQADKRILFLEMSSHYHQLLAERANFLHGARVLRTWEDFQKIIGMQALEQPDAMLRAVHEHEEFLDAVIAHDQVRARAATERHLMKTLSRLQGQETAA